MELPAAAAPPTAASGRTSSRCSIGTASTFVVCGHEHHYERSHPIRGHQPNDTLTPTPVDTRKDVVDTSRGTVHMVNGGGGTSAPSNGLFYSPDQCRMITDVGPVDPATGKKKPIYPPPYRPPRLTP